MVPAVFILPCSRDAHSSLISPSLLFLKIQFLVCFLISFIFCSSEATKARAKVLADEIGSWHLDVSIDGVVSALLSLFQTLTGKRPHYKVD